MIQHTRTKKKIIWRSVCGRYVCVNTEHILCMVWFEIVQFGVPNSVSLVKWVQLHRKNLVQGKIEVRQISNYSLEPFGAVVWITPEDVNVHLISSLFSFEQSLLNIPKKRYFFADVTEMQLFIFKELTLQFLIGVAHHNQMAVQNVCSNKKKEYPDFN